MRDLQQVELIVRQVGEFLGDGDLNRAAAGVFKYVSIARKLLQAGQATGQRFAVMANVVGLLRATKPDCPRFHGIVEQAGNGVDFGRVGGAVAGRFAHDEGP